MPNGMDCCCLLQTEPRCVPTQWLVFDCTPSGRCSEWFREDKEKTIDYIWLRHGLDRTPPDADTAPVKRAFIDLRPTAVAAMLDTYRSRRNFGSGGRLVIWFIGDVSDSFSTLLLAELPLDLSNVIFWESGWAPAVIRGAIGAGTDERQRFLSIVCNQYFRMPDFFIPYHGKHEKGQLYGNEFDSCLLAPDDVPLRAVIQHLVPLHLEETRFAADRTEPHLGGGTLVIEEVMERSLKWRRIDWLAIAQYPYFPRLWDTEKSDILDVLDYRRCPQRVKDPWAALKHRSREKNWDHLNFRPETHDLMQLEQPYRISPGDMRSRLSLAQFLLRCDDRAGVLEHCSFASNEAKDKVDAVWLKIEGLARYGLGEQERARALFQSYRRKLLSIEGPSASTFDEVGAIALMEAEWKLAVEYALKAIEIDKHLLHAYDTLVIAARKSHNPEWEELARSLADKNCVKVPIHVREQAQQVVRAAKPIGAAPKPQKKWWQFSK